MNLCSAFFHRHWPFKTFLILGCLSCVWLAQGQPTIVSTVPSNGGSVSTNGPIVFTFSTGMDTNATDVTFLDSATFASYTTSNWWSSGDTVLTCTPTPAFPVNRTVQWFASGQDTNGNALGGLPFGTFTTTGGSGGSTGSGTNKITTFVVGKTHIFDQYSAGAPVIDTNVPYDFSAITTLASNRTASSVTLALPTGSVSNLTQNFLHPEQFYMFVSYTNLTALDTNFPTGNYTFSVTGSSNQTAVVNLPASLVQPPMPHVVNFTAAQSVIATQAFTLTWDGFTNGTSTDFVFVSVGGVFQTPEFNAPGALTGTATSVVIPANTLQANTSYDASVGFYRATIVSNATFATVAYVATVTDFTLITSSGSHPPTLVMTNSSFSAGIFACDVTAPPSQTITVEYSPTLLPGSWLGLLTTNTPAGGRVHVTDSHSLTNRHLFYRARTGS